MSLPPTPITPVILCGGSGTRLWPLSRKLFPKQFVPLIDGKSLLGDPSKAKKKLGWVPEITAQEMCKEMVANDLAQAKQHALLKQHGYSVNVSAE